MRMEPPGGSWTMHYAWHTLASSSHIRPQEWAHHFIALAVNRLPDCAVGAIPQLLDHLISVVARFRQQQFGRIEALPYYLPVHNEACSSPARSSENERRKSPNLAVSNNRH